VIVKDTSRLRIQHYRFGQLTLDGETYLRDLMVTADAVHDSWWRREGHKLCLEDLVPILKDPPEVLVIGQGDPGLMRVPDDVLRALEARGIEVVAAPTNEAVAVFNRLAGQRKVAGAFHLTC
jgi:hypothetical protein